MKAISKPDIDNAPIILVGNKTDLESEVSVKEASRFAESNSLMFFETSCKNNEGIEEVSEYIENTLSSEFRDEKRWEFWAENSEDENSEDEDTRMLNYEGGIVQEAIETSFDANNEFKNIKVIILGDSQSGKSSIWNRIMRNEFTDNYRLTIGVKIACKTYLYKGEKRNVEFWDITGKDKYRAFIKSYYSSTSVAILVYDCMNKNSFFKLKSSIKELEDIAESKIKINNHWK